MDSQGQFVATLIETSSKAFAAGSVTRLGETGGDEVDTWGFRQLVADAQARLETLAEALAAGRPEVLRLDVEWLASTYAAREVPITFLRRTLVCLRDELADGLPKDAGAMASAYLDSAIDGLVESPQEITSFLVDGQPHVDLARAFLLAVLEGRGKDAEQMLVDAFEGGASVAELHRHVIRSVQREMGRMWQVGDVLVAEEHLGSRIVEQALASLRSRMPRAEETGRSVLISSVRGNLHDIGGRIVADHFEMAGWRALFLGADTPTEDLVAAVGHFEVDLVALSVGLGLNLRATAEMVEAIHAGHPDVPVVVGGRPFEAIPDLWETVGADGSAPDASGAVAEGERLLARGKSTPR